MSPPCSTATSRNGYRFGRAATSRSSTSRTSRSGRSARRPRSPVTSSRRSRSRAAGSSCTRRRGDDARRSTRSPATTASRVGLPRAVDLRRRQCATAARRSTIAVPSQLGANAERLEPFVDVLLDELDRIGFRGGPRWIWSYHNYNDFELDQAPRHARCGSSSRPLARPQARRRPDAVLDRGRHPARPRSGPGGPDRREPGARSTDPGAPGPGARRGVPAPSQPDRRRRGRGAVHPVHDQRGPGLRLRAPRGDRRRAERVRRLVRAPGVRRHRRRERVAARQVGGRARGLSLPPPYLAPFSTAGRYRG